MPTMNRRYLVGAIVISTVIAAALAAAFVFLVDSTQGKAGPSEMGYLSIEVSDAQPGFQTAFAMKGGR